MKVLKVVAKLEKDQQVPGEDWDCLIWSNGKLLTSSYANGKVKVWDKTLHLLQEFEAHEYPICHMCRGPGQTFFTASSDCTIRHWKDAEKESPILLSTLKGHEEPVRRVVYDEKRNWLFSGDDLGKVFIWKESGDLLSTLDIMEEVWELAVYNNLLVTARHLDIVVHTVEEKDGKIRQNMKTEMPGKGPFVLISNKFCYVDRLNFSIHVNDGLKGCGHDLGELRGHSSMINGMASSGETLFSGGTDNKVFAWDLTTFSSLAEMCLDGYVNAMTSDPETGIIYVGGQDKFLVALKLD